MTNWIIKKIKNKNSKYDFRLINKKFDDYSSINFFKHSTFRIIVSLSSYLTNGIIFKNNFYKLELKGKIPAIFDFSINKSNLSNKFITANNDLSKIIFVNNQEKLYLSTLALPDSKVYSSLFEFEEIIDVVKFINSNKISYNHVNFDKKSRYIITGYVNISSNSCLILDLLKSKNKKSIVTRCKIFDEKIINKIKYVFELTNKIKEGYCLLIVKFNEDFFFDIDYIIPITFDEYLTYLYDLMLPYKYDFNDFEDYNDNNVKIYDNNDIERNAFAIDPDKSKDRDDAISAFYLKNNNIVSDTDNPTHLKLIVHISDTLSYIRPDNGNYYYHYSKYKCNTNYLDKYNLPMMDRLLSENFLSLDGDNNNAITINLIYRIVDNKKFLIKPFPDNVYMHRSKNLNIFGTTYDKFSSSFSLEKEENFGNENFIKRKTINCNENLIRDFNEFIHEGSNLYPNKIKKEIANNLKQLYIYFVNSLNHTGKDTLIKISSNLVRKKINKVENIYLDFLPSDMWCHSLIEYTALEANIYFSYFMLLKDDIKNRLYINKDDIKSINYKLGEKNIRLLFDNILKNKIIKTSKLGIFRNLFQKSDNIEYYLSEEIIKKIKNIHKPYKNSINPKVYSIVLEKFLKKFGYKYKGKLEMNTFLKLILSLKQILLLINSNSNLDITTKLISPDIKMKATYSFFPLAHYDICTLLYTHATSPMRRFVDINVHNFIFFSESKNYIYKNLDLMGINLSVNIGKYINQLVISKRFTELIEINKNLITNAKMIDDNTIGFIELNNFFRFSDSFYFGKGINKIKLKLDKYNIPIIEVIKDGKEFNVFLHMLSTEDKKLKSKVIPFLKKIINVKKLNKIC